MCLQADTGAQCNVLPLELYKKAKIYVSPSRYWSSHKKATNICVSKQILELSVMCCL